MESKLLEFYTMSKSKMIEFLTTLSIAELTDLMNDATSCYKTVEDLSVAYDAFEQLEKKRNTPFIRIWWLIKKTAKKAWEDACNAAESEINKKERAIMNSYIWQLLDIEKDQIMAKYTSVKKEHMVVRRSAAIYLKLNIKEKVLPLLIAEAKSR